MPKKWYDKGVCLHCAITDRTPEPHHVTYLHTTKKNLTPNTYKNPLSTLAPNFDSHPKSTLSPKLQPRQNIHTQSKIQSKSPSHSPNHRHNPKILTNHPFHVPIKLPFQPQPYTASTFPNTQSKAISTPSSPHSNLPPHTETPFFTKANSHLNQKSDLKISISESYNPSHQTQTPTTSSSSQKNFVQNFNQTSLKTSLTLTRNNSILTSILVQPLTYSKYTISKLRLYTLLPKFNHLIYTTLTNFLISTSKIITLKNIQNYPIVNIYTKSTPNFNFTPIP